MEQIQRKYNGVPTSVTSSTLTAVAGNGYPINTTSNACTVTLPAAASGGDQIIFTDRGTFMGYNMLVNDMTSLQIMNRTGHPVCFDATHSIQLPTSMGNISGGQREFIPFLVRQVML